MKITEWPSKDRPREKLILQGATALSDAELLAIFLRTGTVQHNVVELAKTILTHFGSLHALFASNIDEFSLLPGLGKAKYAQLHAGLEMAKRYLQEQLSEQPHFVDSEQTKHFVALQLRRYTREVFAALALDAQHQLLHFEVLFSGTIDKTAVYPREVAKFALAHNAAAIIVAHNHPSGVAEPSVSDQQITTALQNALKLLDIRLLDHLVVGIGSTVSLAERGFI
ncbi:MAG: DNA repair protein RadC [Alteromonadaceae bacterium]|nr:DNA repair protein RadC [Alteromonadaceae bacterium]